MYKGPPTVLAIFIIVKLGTLVPIAFQLAATGEPVAEAMRRLLLQRDGVDRITIISAWLTNPVLDEFSGILRPLLIENPETELLVIIGSNHHQAISSPLACRRILELQIEFGNRVRFLRYPHENGSTFHAKLYTVRSTIDDETWHGVLIGSANATAKGFGTSTPRNIESYAYEYPIPEEGVENLESQILETEFILAENTRLKNTIDEIDYVSDEIIAKVIVDKQSPFLKSIIINRGSKHQVKLGMAVLDDKFLVGKVVEVNFSTSRVLLLSDLNSKIPVDIMPNEILSILSGTGQDYGIIQYQKGKNLINNDDRVFTSGAGGIFKSGIPIGKIDKNSENEEVRVNFLSDYSQLRFVKLKSFSKEVEQ